ncbi:hypothetical protein BQ8794_50575 [Mesorhizobium prunaredense]|uniref:Uncharacterized protein n=1 Tax=Mesorhizobium prunaredense TaxID=1631249 RepID=A0A1R3VGT0_9HYPH|nr:hypothetical protein BQ8794_50575 [Mesorhizobium prunaredense]
MILLCPCIRLIRKRGPPPFGGQSIFSKTAFGVGQLSYALSEREQALAAMQLVRLERAVQPLPFRSTGMAFQTGTALHDGAPAGLFCPLMVI